MNVQEIIDAHHARVIAEVEKIASPDREVTVAATTGVDGIAQQLQLANLIAVAQTLPVPVRDSIIDHVRAKLGIARDQEEVTW